MMSYKIISDMIDVAENPAFDKEFPAFISRQLDTSTELVLELLVCYMNTPTENSHRGNICLRLIDECFKKIRYSLDRKEKEAIDLIGRIQINLFDVFKSESYHKLSDLNAIINMYNLPINKKTLEKKFANDVTASLARYDIEL